jgi:hypothetical protein
MACFDENSSCGEKVCTPYWILHRTYIKESMKIDKISRTLMLILILSLLGQK